MRHAILVPLDGSAFAEQALDVAAALALRSGVPLLLAYAHPPLDLPGDTGTLTANILEWDAGRQEQMRSYLATVAGRLCRPGLAVSIVVLEGDPVAAISREAASHSVNLIVMTTHGRTGLSRAWLGSVADGLVHHSDVPLLLVRPPVEHAGTGNGAPFHRILVPLDGSPAAEQALDPAVAVARLSDAQITLLRIVAPPQPPVDPFTFAPTTDGNEIFERQSQVAEEYLDRCAQQVRDCGVTVDEDVAVSDAPARKILDAASECGADLIAMTARGHGLRRVLLGSTVDKVLRGSGLPLLLQRPRHDQ